MAAVEPHKAEFLRRVEDYVRVHPDEVSDPKKAQELKTFFDETAKRLGVEASFVEDAFTNVRGDLNSGLRWLVAAKSAEAAASAKKATQASALAAPRGAGVSIAGRVSAMFKLAIGKPVKSEEPAVTPSAQEKPNPPPASRPIPAATPSRPGPVEVSGWLGLASNPRGRYFTEGDGVCLEFKPRFTSEKPDPSVAIIAAASLKAHFAGGTLPNFVRITLPKTTDGQLAPDSPRREATEAAQAFAHQLGMRVLSFSVRPSGRPEEGPSIVFTLSPGVRAGLLPPGP